MARVTITYKEGSPDSFDIPVQMTDKEAEMLVEQARTFKDLHVADKFYAPYSVIRSVKVK